MLCTCHPTCHNLLEVNALDFISCLLKPSLFLIRCLYMSFHFDFHLWSMYCNLLRTILLVLFFVQTVWPMPVQINYSDIDLNFHFHLRIVAVSATTTQRTNMSYRGACQCHVAVQKYSEYKIPVRKEEN